MISSEGEQRGRDEIYPDIVTLYHHYTHLNHYQSAILMHDQP